ncbi:hypothetical protein ALI144C_07885 [Actinosynnema sp. ALI-1.44]|nr:hypothetical protein ALI144C_07885 [Actinosynnema sp. ALI-1.44]
MLARRSVPDPLLRIRRFLALVDPPGPLRQELASRVRVVEVDLTELAEDVDVIWHCAGDTDLTGDLEPLRQTNVEGTRRVLEWAALCPRKPVVHHLSTAFVAGRRGVTWCMRAI